MSKKIDDLLGPFVGDEQREMAHSGRAEQQTYRRLSGMGDRKSDALARQIAMSPLYNSPTLLDASTSLPAKNAASSDSNRALAQEIDRQISSSPTSSNRNDPPDRGWDSAFIDPNKSSTLVLAPKTSVKNPRISVSTDWGWQNFKITSITQDNKPVLVNTSLDALKQGVVFQGTVNKDHPVKITVSYSGKYRGSIQGTLKPS